jgi:pyruvate kinase
MSHAPHPWVRRVVKDLRAAAAARKVPFGILMDTQGPAIRTGDVPAPIELHPGQKFTFTVRGERCVDGLSVEVNYENFVNDLTEGNTILVDNGEILMRVLAKFPNKVECEVLTPGKLGSRRHINLPGVKVSLPALTEKDLADIALGKEIGVDFVALSFVREAKDILQLKAVLGDDPKRPLVVAKIEDQQAILNINEIIAEADAVMVARGDLGIECPYEELPIIQRKIIKTCLRVGRPVIVATHMLESMIENPGPTRAEVTDVANAVFEQADAIMLSGETTTGKYPLKCIEVFDKIARRIERSGGANFQERAELTSPRQKLVRSAVGMAEDLRAAGVLVFTIRGSMARYASWMRPHYSPVFAVCESWGVANALSLNWGVHPVVIPFDHGAPEKTIDVAMSVLAGRGLLQRGQQTVVVSAISSGAQIVDAVQMRTV